jgi:hypothetical protein
MPAEGLWISPDRGHVAVVEHLIAIQQHPRLFGLTSREVSGLSLRGLRGIAEQLIDEGWIRYRGFGYQHLFEMKSLDKGTVDDVLVDAASHPTDIVVIETTSPRREYKGTVEEWYGRSMLRHWESNPRLGWRISR